MTAGDSPTWVPVAVVRAVHDRQIARHGGTPGLRDLTLLEMGCARPMNQWAYGQPDLHDLAAAYAFGLAKAHAFIDGNKRSALVAALVFLRLNGAALVPHQATAVRMMEGLAEGPVTEPAFARWLREGAGGEVPARSVEIPDRPARARHGVPVSQQDGDANPINRPMD